MKTLTSDIKRYAQSLGFDVVKITHPSLPERDKAQLDHYLAQSHHGDMSWMATKAELRKDPLALWPEAKSIIMVGHNYGPDENPLDKLHQTTIGNISCYALGDDYHDIIKKKLRLFAQWLVSEHACDVKLFVDTAPVMEKALAAQAGIGWQGKHSCLVSREFGSWLFLGSVFTTLSLEFDAAEKDHCGRCTSCIDICPTQAITAPGKLEATRCIAYLTNEHKGQIPLEFRKAIGNRIYGCDDCLAVCPWNKFAQTSQETAYHARDAYKNVPLKQLVSLDDSAFRELFRKSPIKRIGRDRFVRNVLVAVGNSNDPSLIARVEPLLSDNCELVSEMAAWALGELKNATI
ncbi:MAG: tRNA epoxyqueuosine(34) reductase QueG [Rickettsiales bacterium]|nr:tRNA epoxyqueuosine(34) reductase QueG [Rickettsiales bacterium]